MNKELVVLAIAGLSFLTFSSFQADTLNESVKRGAEVYQANCVSCHMEKGEGLEGAFPPLAKTGRLTDKKRLIKILYQGMTGKITVNGKQYDMEMNPTTLSEEEAADVLNYIRNAWGNKSPMIRASDVKQLKVLK